MWQRCTNPKNPSFKRYGGRGIRVCDRWKDFALFLEDVGPRPSAKHSLDRHPDNDGDYEPGNVRWATPEEQQGNTSANRRLTYRGVTHVFAEWSRITGIQVSTIKVRIDRLGWSTARALTTSIRTKKDKLHRLVLAAGYSSVSDFLRKNTSMNPASLYRFANGETIRLTTRAKIEALLTTSPEPSGTSPSRPPASSR
jgi:hypothetical protein